MSQSRRDTLQRMEILQNQAQLCRSRLRHETREAGRTSRWLLRALDIGMIFGRLVRRH